MLRGAAHDEGPADALLAKSLPRAFPRSPPARAPPKLAGGGAGMADAEDEADAGLMAPLVVHARGLRATPLPELQRAAAQGFTRSSGDQVFQWLISPVTCEQFYAEVWEKRPLLVQRAQARDFYAGLFSKAAVEELLERQSLEYGRNVDVAKHEDGIRHTLNGEGVAVPADVWDKYGDGCSVRLLHPQQWNNNLWWLLSTLERHWQQLAGCNVYLTPAGSQGFSPHYDDIDAFILQIEGSKRWRCYAPPTEQDFLGRFSSPDFAEDEIGEPILDTVLEPGDLLYLPRGVVHQAQSTEAGHSLHLTISTGQRNTMADFLQMALPRALELAAEEHVELRRSLPLDVFDFMGVVHSDEQGDSRRAAFLASVKSSFMRILESGPWDSAVDQLAGSFMRQRLPPFRAVEAPQQADTVTQASAESHTGVGHERKRAKSERGRGPRGHASWAQLSVETAVTGSVEGGCRLIVEDDSAVVYHMMDNVREEHNAGDGEASGMAAEDLKGRIEFPLECAHWLEVLTDLSASVPTPIADVIQRCNPGDVSRNDTAAVLSIVQTLAEHKVVQLHPSLRHP